MPGLVRVSAPPGMSVGVTCAVSDTQQENILFWSARWSAFLGSVSAAIIIFVAPYTRCSRFRKVLRADLLDVALQFVKLLSVLQNLCKRV